MMVAGSSSLKEALTVRVVEAGWAFCWLDVQEDVQVEIRQDTAGS
jgi:hypothetical protein